jgi:hypothetical protein
VRDLCVVGGLSERVIRERVCVFADVPLCEWLCACENHKEETPEMHEKDIHQSEQWPVAFGWRSPQSRLLLQSMTRFWVFR